jgi:hypothetical protein
MEPAATAGPTKPQLAQRLAGRELDQRLRIERSTLLIQSDGSGVGQCVWNCDEREREWQACVCVSYPPLQLGSFQCSQLR